MALALLSEDRPFELRHMTVAVPSTLLPALLPPWKCPHLRRFVLASSAGYACMGKLQGCTARRRSRRTGEATEQGSARVRATEQAPGRPCLLGRVILSKYPGLPATHNAEVMLTKVIRYFVPSLRNVGVGSRPGPSHIASGLAVFGAASHQGFQSGCPWTCASRPHLGQGT